MDRIRARNHPAYNIVGSLYPKVTAGLGSSMASCLMGVALWHDFEYKESDVDAEAGFYLKQQVLATDGVRVYELPETTVASTVHNGAYCRLPEAYDPLLRWVADHGYQVAVRFASFTSRSPCRCGGMTSLT
ncbi:MAG: GyrI-like domain-containing protein [Silvibacterium sp.]